MAQSKKTLTVRFSEIEEKKHSIRWNCTEENPAIQSIYISRKALEKAGIDGIRPIEITITQ